MVWHNYYFAENLGGALFWTNLIKLISGLQTEIGL